MTPVALASTLRFRPILSFVLPLRARYAAELNERLPTAVVPQMFAGGDHIGGYDEIFKLNEQGQLKNTLAKFITEEAPMQVRALATGYLVTAVQHNVFVQQQKLRKTHVYWYRLVVRLFTKLNCFN